MPSDSIFDWRGSTRNPNDRAVRQALDQVLRDKTSFDRRSRDRCIVDFCTGKSVLDIGAAGHLPDPREQSGWEHGLIRGVASKVVAVDLDQENCDRLNALGFDFRCIDATSEAYLGERFDCIFAGDVIEHVNDPVAFLVFAKRHLKESGSLLLTTPNPFARRYRASRSKGGYLYVMANLEHTTWFSTTTMLEVAARAELCLSAVRWPLLKKRGGGFKDVIKVWWWRAIFAISSPENWKSEYMFELRHPDSVDARRN